MAQQNSSLDLKDAARVAMSSIRTTLDSIEEDLDKEDSAGLIALGKVFEIAGLKKLTVAMYKQAVELDADSLEARHRLALALLKDDDYDEGLRAAEELVARDRNHTLAALCSDERRSALTLLGDALALSRRTDDALATYQDAFAEDGDDSYAAGRLTQAKLFTGRDTDVSDIEGRVGNNPRFADLKSRFAVANDQIFGASLAFRSLHDAVFNTVGGRPVVIDGESRSATTADSSEWLEDLALQSVESEATVREDIVEHWQRLAVAEHASIAAFACFILDMMSLGAPPDLLAGAAKAIDEEIGHAKGAFAVASELAGHDVGPGVLDTTNMYRGQRSASDILLGTFHDGCIGEGLSAAYAQAACATIEDDNLRAMFGRVAREEAGHAELAWRFVEWLLDVRPQLHDVFSAAVERLELFEPAPGVATSSAPHLGLLDAATKSATCRDVLRNGILPRARTLAASRRDAPRMLVGSDL